ncbi:MAG: hypothetical protein CMJ93_06880 [Planctomycetes bacterium]|nr:hypothetical protein [Planctomycetota bacterium]
MIDFFGSIWSILVEAGPWLLGGFFIAGLLKEYIPQDKVFKHLGRNNFGSVFKASIIGAPLPLCSCSVIPTAASLKQAGASRGATTAFLIATPETGADSVGITYALMDPLMTILRPVSAVLTAIISGCLVNNLNFPPEEKINEEQSCCASVTPPAKPSVVMAFKFGYGKLMADLAPWFILGFILSALIALFVPDNFFGDVIPGGWLSLIAMLLMSLPMYICASASTPIAVALIIKGLDPGAALVLLLVGPATNITTILIIKELIGKSALRVYLAGLAGTSLIIGYLVNIIYSKLDYNLAERVVVDSHQHASLYSEVAGIILGALLIWHYISSFFKESAN